MTEKHSQDTHQELEFQARQAELSGAVGRTPPEVIERYRHHRQWRYSPREYIFHSIKQCQPELVCDFGCAAGETSTELGAIGYRVIGLDLSPELIALAKRRAELDGVQDRVEFLVGDGRTLDMKSGQFDLVLTMAVLHHLVNVQECLDVLDGLMRPKGYVIIQEPIVLSSFLKRLRTVVPVKSDLSPNERQLYPEDLALIESHFEVVEKRHFHLLTRLLRLVPERFATLHQLASQILSRLDYFLIEFVPGLSHFSGQVIYTCRKRGA